MFFILVAFFMGMRLVLCLAAFVAGCFAVFAALCGIVTGCIWVLSRFF